MDVRQEAIVEELVSLDIIKIVKGRIAISNTFIRTLDQEMQHYHGNVWHVVTSAIYKHAPNLEQEKVDLCMDILQDYFDKHLQNSAEY
ncbi:MAG: hypothetical protein ACE5J2_06645 [Nitrososphaerales archaeon]